MAQSLMLATDIGEQGVGEAAGDKGEVLAGLAVEVLGGGACGWGYCGLVCCWRGSIPI